MARNATPTTGAAPDGNALFTAWTDQLQRLNQQSLAAWSEAFSASAQDAAQVRSLEDLAALPAQVVNRQLETALRQFGQLASFWMEAELQWMEALREQTGGLAQRWVDEAQAAFH